MPISDYADDHNRYHSENIAFSAAPPGDDDVVWRFMDTPKFLALLTTSSIPLIRADLFEDDQEGSLPSADRIDLLNRIAELEPATRFARGATEMTRVAQIRLNYRKYWNRRAHISSWYRQDNDTNNMWKAYGAVNNAVAIKSTYCKLKAECRDDLDIGMIRYIDYDTDRLGGNAALATFSHKRHFYRDEMEVRVMKLDGRSYRYEEDVPNYPSVLMWEVDLQKLITGIVISPFAASWFFNTVKLVTKTYGLAPDLVEYSRMKMASVILAPS